MERHVKERLIGAAVLVAAAVILIPEMLSGPERPEPQAQAPAASGTLKTYTIDLSRSPGSNSVTQDVPDQAPPPETLPPAQPAATDEPRTAETSPDSGDSSPPKEPSVAGEGSVPQPASTVAEQPRTQSRETLTTAPTKPATQERTRVEPEPKPTKPAATPASAGWAVQVGSFASQGTAAKLAKDLQANGFDSFVMPVKSGGSTLYRVRIGPMQDRDAAVRTLNRVKGRVSSAAVVKHP